MKKVLIVFNHPAPYKVRLFNEISKSLDLTVIFERNKNSNRSKSFYCEDKYLFKTAKIHGLKIGEENILSCGVKNHIKKNKYDLIVMNGYSQFAEIKAIRYMQKKNIPYALFINGGIIKEKEYSWKKNLKTSLISKAKFYLSPDEESNKYLIYYGAKSESIFNYPYSTIYEKEILKEPHNDLDFSKIKEEFGLKGNRVFVSAGQFIKRKNYQALIENWKDMPSDHYLYIFGDGKEKNRCKKIIKELHLNNVVLHGFLPKDKLLKVFSVSDYFVFPSNEDIYGHVINESLSQGLPVISNININSSKKLINKNNGVLTDDFSATNILSSLEKIKRPCFEDCINVAKENTIEKMSKTITKVLMDN